MLNCVWKEKAIIPRVRNSRSRICQVTQICRMTLGIDVYRIQSINIVAVPGSASERLNLEDCSGCGEKAWGWQDNGYGAVVMGPAVRFSDPRGTHTIKITTREDGFSIDQIVLSSANYLSAAPGTLKNDATILPACPQPPLR